MVGRLVFLIALAVGGSALSRDDAALASELEAATAQEYGAVLEEVSATFDGHSQAHRYESALFLAHAMYADASRRGEAYLRTRVWAASMLGLVQTRAGLHDGAELVVSAEIEFLRSEVARLTATLASAEKDSADLRAWRSALHRDLVGLYDRRALARLGAGHIEAARSDLGAALAGGSRDAALVLGRLALREGQQARARRLLGSLLHEDQGEAWARRGWGLTMLP